MLEWKEYGGECNIKGLARKYLGNYCNYFPNILILTAQEDVCSAQWSVEKGQYD